VLIKCDNKYPTVAPLVKFKSRVNISCANKLNGEVEPAKLEILRCWKQDYTIETILLAIFNEMSYPANKKLSQPDEKSTY